MAGNSRIITRPVTKRLTLAAGVYAGEKIEIVTVDIPPEYDQITGLGVRIGADAGVANADYEVAMDDENGELMPWEHIGSIATGKSDGTEPDKRYKTLGPFPVRGAGKLTLKAKVPAQTTSADLKLAFSVRVEKMEVRSS